MESSAERDTSRLLPSQDLEKTRFGSIVAVSLAFLMLFLAFNSLQNYVTSLLPDGLGNESLAVLYISVCIFVFTAPHISSRLGDKRTMIAGSFCYLAYMGSLIHPVRWVVLLAAVIVGQLTLCAMSNHGFLVLISHIFSVVTYPQPSAVHTSCATLYRVRCSDTVGQRGLLHHRSLPALGIRKE